MTPFFAAHSAIVVAPDHCVWETRAKYGERRVIIPVAALNITVGVLLWVMTGAMANTLGVNTYPPKICAPSRTISSWVTWRTRSGPPDSSR